MDDIFLAYYSKHPQLYVKTEAPIVTGTGASPTKGYVQNITWFNMVLNDYFESLIPTAIKELNSLDKPSTAPGTISRKLLSLPNDVQQRIVEVAVSAKILEVSCNVANSIPPLPKQLAKEWKERDQQKIFCSKKRFRAIILDHYKNYYRIDDVGTFKMAIVWFLSDIVEERAKEKCLYGASLNVGPKNQISRPLWNEWKVCNKKERARVEKERSLIKKQYETSLGYYGLWNPKNNEFCIRDVREGTIEGGKKDKRTVPSGKRCINWTKPALTELAAIAINAPLPSGAVLPSLDAALKEIRENRDLRKVVPQNVDDNLVVRLVFWYGLSRSDICVNLRKWFEENNLLVEDNSCGVQTKRK
jgi:hypothetical protein